MCLATWWWSIWTIRSGWFENICRYSDRLMILSNQKQFQTYLRRPSNLILQCSIFQPMLGLLWHRNLERMIICGFIKSFNLIIGWLQSSLHQNLPYIIPISGLISALGDVASIFISQNGSWPERGYGLIAVARKFHWQFLTIFLTRNSWRSKSL